MLVERITLSPAHFRRLPGVARRAGPVPPVVEPLVAGAGS